MPRPRRTGWRHLRRSYPTARSLIQASSDRSEPERLCEPEPFCEPPTMDLVPGISAKRVNREPNGVGASLTSMQTATPITAQFEFQAFKPLPCGCVAAMHRTLDPGLN